MRLSQNPIPVVVVVSWCVFVSLCFPYFWNIDMGRSRSWYQAEQSWLSRGGNWSGKKSSSETVVTSVSNTQIISKHVNISIEFCILWELHSSIITQLIWSWSAVVASSSYLVNVANFIKHQRFCLNV